MKYMIMMFGDGAALMATRSEQWIGEMIGFMTRLDQELRDSGELVFQAGLADGSAAKTFRADGGTVAATDGPFAEAKESLIGYWSATEPRPATPTPAPPGSPAACRSSSTSSNSSPALHRQPTRHPHPTPNRRAGNRQPGRLVSGPDATGRLRMSRKAVAAGVRPARLQMTYSTRAGASVTSTVVTPVSCGT
jgi:hypothetical protein